MPNTLRQYLAATSYEGILFPAVDLNTAWGHDKATHQALLTPAADIQTTGRKSYVTRMRIAFCNDIQGWYSNLFPDLYEQLMQKFVEVPLGTLVHPTKGSMLVHTDDIQEHVDPKIANAVFVDVTWTERSSADAVFAGQTDVVDLNIGSPEDATVETASTADALTPDLPAGSVTEFVSISPVISTMLLALNSGTVSIRLAHSAFATAIQSIRANIDLAVSLGVDAHDYRAAVEACLASVYRYRDTYLSEKKPTYVRVPVTMSLGRVAALPQVYGDPSKAYLLRLNNSIPDETAVAAGSVIAVLPIVQ